ncbi:GNAT family N-acetyltransferase [Colwellia psychrerythraea]|uniref:GCN5-related N-acetyltransferase n=1 Tax=Colwellia psychrerythraea TaxID=28229 RepID=A0A099KJB7_COLPS|nr:GNAT family N-acetyltransferase [Colwellia psychrerythraea]KGJ90929.1 GCN5-related N-acetyltransferase [Colwellia psychrerythraea]
MNIRIATKQDINSLCQLIESLSHFYLADKDANLPHWFSETLTKEAFLQRIESTEYNNFVYEIQGSIAGYLAFKGDSYLYHLFVSEDHQGKGVARYLWDYATTKCVAKCYTLRSSLNAVPIYKKFGFKVVGDAKERDGMGFQEMTLRR